MATLTEVEKLADGEKDPRGAVSRPARTGPRHGFRPRQLTWPFP